MAHEPDPNVVSLCGLNIAGDLGALTYYTSKRKKVVWFLKAPPTKPPSTLQITTRNAFRIAAMCWRHLTPQRRAAWETATKTASLCMTGYNLFVHSITRGNLEAIRTIERQTGQVLLDPP